MSPEEQKDFIERQLLSKMHLHPDNKYSLNTLISSIDYLGDLSLVAEVVESLAKSNRLQISEMGGHPILRLTSKEVKRGQVEDPVISVIRSEIELMQEKSRQRRLATTKRAMEMVQRSQRRKPIDFTLERGKAKTRTKTKREPVVVIHPDGRRENVVNLSEFCRNRNLSYSSMHKTSIGLMASHHGFMVERESEKTESHEIMQKSIAS